MANATIYTLGGNVKPHEGIYIRRKTDDELFECCEAGRFAYVLTSRQLGKSSLMVHTAERLASAGKRIAIISLEQIGTEKPEQFYLDLVSSIADAVRLETDVIQWWLSNSNLGLISRLNAFFENVLLKQVSENVVIFIDEIDLTLNLEFKDDFFAAIRYFHNARAHKPEFNRLTFVLIGTAMPGDLIDDPLRTPFNVGEWIVLSDFTFEEALPLTTGFGLSGEDAEKVLEWILEWTAGHPYLTQRLCWLVAAQSHKPQSKEEVDAIVANLFLKQKGKFEGNLAFVRDMLTKRMRPEIEPGKLLRVYRKITQGKTVSDEKQSIIKSHLKLAGIVSSEGNALRVRNQIYRRVFDKAWVGRAIAELPTNWKRRLSLTAATLVVLVLLTLIPLSAIAINRAKAAERALAAATSATEKLQRAIEDAHVAYEGAEAARRELERVVGKEQFAKREVQQLLERETVAKGEAEEQRAIAETQREKANELQKIAFSREIAASSLLRLPANPELSTLLAIEAVNINPTSEATSSIRQALLGHRLSLTMRDHSEPVRQAEYSPDGKTLLSVSDDKTLVWDAATGRTLFELRGHSDIVNTAHFSPDGRRIVTASDDGTDRIWDAATGDNLFVLTGQLGAQISATFSPDGKHILTASLADSTRVWDSMSGRCIFEFSGKNSVASPCDARVVTETSSKPSRDVGSKDSPLITALRGVAASASVEKDFDPTREPDSRAAPKPFKREVPEKTARYALDGTILTIDTNGDVQIWNSETGIRKSQLEDDEEKFETAVSSPDGQYVLATARGRIGKYLYLFTINNDQVASKKQIGMDLSEDGFEPSFSPDGKYFVCGGESNSVRLQETETGRDIVLQGQTSPLQTAVFSPNGKYLATTDRSSTARLWEIERAKLLFVMQSHTSTVINSAFSPDSNSLVTAGNNHTVRVWTLSGGYHPLPLKTEQMSANGVVFSPNGESAVVDDRVDTRFFNTATGLSPIALDTASYNSLPPVFSPDGKYFVVGSKNSGVEVRDAVSGSVRFNLDGHREKVLSASFSPDGSHVVTSSSDKTARVWDMTSGHSTVVLLGHRNRVNSAEFNPDGRSVVTASDDNTARLWDAASGTQLKVLIHGRDVARATFNSSGSLLATVDRYGGTYVWDTQTNNNPRFVGWRITAIGGAIFSPNGKLVVTLGSEYTVVISDAESGRQVAILQGHTDVIRHVLFSPNGEIIVSTGDDHMMRVWESSTGSQLFARDIDHYASKGDRFINFSAGGGIMLLTTEGVLDTYDCEVCNSTNVLVSLAQSRVTRTLSATEKERYLHVPYK